MPSYEAHCTLAYPPEQLFDLAADVEGYPEFLPWWIAVRVRKREADVYYTDQVVGFGVVRQRFDTKTVLRRPGRIDVTSNDRKFRRFHLTWLFDPLPNKGCRVALVVDLELRSKLAQDLFGRAILRTAGSIMPAFEARAHRLYGPTANPCVTARTGGSADPIV
jgi:coenzyme Q-binding protein COQ10